MPQISIIIPCYNQGRYVDEAVNSVLAQTYQDFEIIIVNDGSTDEETNSLLQSYEQPKTRVLTTTNQGLAAARNNGIKEAVGEYILPLDADDCIRATYLEQAVQLLETKEELGIVYCRAELFGAVETEWMLSPYSLKEMLLDNVIFCTALFRRCDWVTVGGYDPGMIYGWEDYDFWLSLIELGRKVYQIPEILFSYRVASDSMVRSKERWQKIEMFKRIFKRHEKLFADNIDVWIDTLLEVREPYYTSKLYVDCGNGISDEECISRKVESTTSEIHFSLSDYHQIKAIRFDPVDTPAVIEIFQIIISTKQGDSRVLGNFTDNSILQENNERYFDSNDSQCYLPLSKNDLESIDTIFVKLTFKALANDALRQIVKLQQDKLRSVSSQLDEYASSGILKAVGSAIRKNEDESGLQYFKRQLKSS